MTEMALPDCCWPVDATCCADFETYDFDVQDRVSALAGQTLRSLTLYQVGGCPVTVRPCTGYHCGNQQWSAQWGAAYYPINWSGVWTNCGCTDPCVHNGIDLALHGRLTRIVGPIDSVKIDGVELDPADYTLIGTVLARTDGLPWPVTQNMVLPDTEPGTFSVTYLPSHPVDANGSFAAGMLACEYARACYGQECRLPNGVVSIVRAGIQMQLTPGSFPGGFTGIPEVDAYIRRWNPYGTGALPVVWSPEIQRSLVRRP